MKPRPFGFTLIELLVVIAVIGLLSALLFPVFARVRERGRQIACLSNERQIGMALLQYAADNDERYPSNQTPESDGIWAFQTYAYLKDAQVYRCPDDPTRDSDRVLGGSKRTERLRYSVDSYGLNSNLTTHIALNPVTGDRKTVASAGFTSALTTPTKTVFLFEVSHATAALTPPDNPHLGCAASGNGGRDPEAPGFPFASGCRPEDGMIVSGTRYATGPIGGRPHDPWGIEADVPRHTGGASYLACDGHAVWQRPERVSGGVSQPPSGSHCGQDETGSGCGGQDTAAGTGNSRYALTFSIH